MYTIKFIDPAPVQKVIWSLRVCWACELEFFCLLLKILTEHELLCLLHVTRCMGILSLVLKESALFIPCKSLILQRMLQVRDSPGDVETIAGGSILHFSHWHQVLPRGHYFALAYVYTVLLSSKGLHRCLWQTWPLIFAHQSFNNVSWSGNALCSSTAMQILWNSEWSTVRN